MAKYLIMLLLCTCSLHAKQNYHIQLGDQIHIALPGETTLNKDFTVSIDGTINLPEIGIITIIGYSETELQKILHQSLSPVFRDMSGFSVFVAKKRPYPRVLGPKPPIGGDSRSEAKRRGEGRLKAAALRAV